MSKNPDQPEPNVTIVRDPHALINQLRREGKPVPELLQRWENSADGQQGPQQ